MSAYIDFYAGQRVWGICVYDDFMSRYAVASLCAISILAFATTAQDSKQPRRVRSLADGLVRQRIEIDRLRPPQISSGTELGSGKGPLVLLIRRASGRFEYEAIERGRGDHGPSPDPDVIVAPEPKKAAKVQPQEAPKNSIGNAVLRVARKDGVLTIATGSGKEVTKGKAIDRSGLKAALKQLFDLRRGTKVATQMVLEIREQATIQDVVTVSELARMTGFSTLLFSGRSKETLKSDDAKRIMSLPSDYGFHVEYRMPQTSQFPVADGELLVLLDGPTLWDDFDPIYRQCIKAGIWRIGLVCQRDMRKRFKLSINLPFDGGL